MFGKGYSIESMAKAAVMKFNHIPRRLYKYRSFSGNHIDALKQGVLYFTATDKLNDIKEANLVISKEAAAVFHQKQYNDLRIKYGFPETSVKDFHTIMQVTDDYFRTRSGIDKGISFLNTPEYKTLELKIKDFYRKQKTAYNGTRKLDQAL